MRSNCVRTRDLAQQAVLGYLLLLHEIFLILEHCDVLFENSMLTTGDFKG